MGAELERRFLVFVFTSLQMLISKSYGCALSNDIMMHIVWFYDRHTMKCGQWKKISCIKWCRNFWKAWTLDALVGHILSPSCNYEINCHFVDYLKINFFGIGLYPSVGINFFILRSTDMWEEFWRKLSFIWIKWFLALGYTTAL